MSRNRWKAKLEPLVILPLLVGCIVPLAHRGAVVADPGRAGDSDLPCSPLQPYDPLPLALEETRQAYLRGDLESTRRWFDYTLALFARTVPGSNRPRWPWGNADELLAALQLYELHARGQDAELDAQYEELAAWLCDIDFLNRSEDEPGWLGGLDVDYDISTDLVDEIGDLRIDYDLITLQISKVGPYRIDYDLITRMPTRIGDIEIEYDLIDHRPDEIAGVPIR